MRKHAPKPESKFSQKDSAPEATVATPVVLDAPEDFNFSFGYGQVRWPETWGRCSC